MTKPLQKRKPIDGEVQTCVTTWQNNTKRAILRHSSETGCPQLAHDRYTSTRHGVFPLFDFQFLEQRHKL